MKIGAREADSDRRNRCFFWLLAVTVILGSIGSERGKPTRQDPQRTETNAEQRVQLLGHPFATQTAGMLAARVNDNSREPQIRSGAAVTPSLFAQPELEIDCFREFDHWLAEYLAAAPSEKPDLEQTGEDLAARRREALATEIERDPEASLRHAVPLQDRQGLPPSVAAQLRGRHVCRRVGGFGKTLAARRGRTGDGDYASDER